MASSTDAVKLWVMNEDDEKKGPVLFRSSSDPTSDVHPHVQEEEVLQRRQTTYRAGQRKPSLLTKVEVLLKNLPPEAEQPPPQWVALRWVGDQHTEDADAQDTHPVDRFKAGVCTRLVAALCCLWPVETIQSFRRAPTGTWRNWAWRFILVSFLVVTRLLLLFDMVSDVLVVQDLYSLGHTNYTLFSISCLSFSYIVGAPFLYTAFKQQMQETFHESHPNLVPVLLAAYCVFAPVGFVLVDICLFTVWLTRNFTATQDPLMFNYMRMRFLTENLFESFPQTGLQIFILTRGELNVNTQLLALSILASVASLIKNSILMWRGARNTLVQDPNSPTNWVRMSTWAYTKQVFLAGAGQVPALQEAAEGKEKLDISQEMTFTQLKLLLRKVQGGTKHLEFQGLWFSDDHLQQVVNQLLEQRAAVTRLTLRRTDVTIKSALGPLSTFLRGEDTVLTLENNTNLGWAAQELLTSVLLLRLLQRSWLKLNLLELHQCLNGSDMDLFLVNPEHEELKRLQQQPASVDVVVHPVQCDPVHVPRLLRLLPPLGPCCRSIDLSACKPSLLSVQLLVQLPEQCKLLLPAVRDTLLAALASRPALVFSEVVLTGHALPGGNVMPWEAAKHGEAFGMETYQAAFMSAWDAFAKPGWNTPTLTIIDEAVQALARATPHLKRANFAQCCRLTDATVHALVENCGGSLQAVNFDDCVLLTDASVQLLADRCPQLERLSFEGCTRITAKALQHVLLPCVERLVEELTALRLPPTAHEVEQLRFSKLLLSGHRTVLRGISDRIPGAECRNVWGYLRFTSHQEEEMKSDTLDPLGCALARIVLSACESGTVSLGRRVAAANALSVLNAARVSLSGVRLAQLQAGLDATELTQQHARIGADLSGAMCDHTDFSGANLSGALLQDAHLCSAELSGATLTEGALGQLPMLLGHGAGITALVASADGATVYSASMDKCIRQWDSSDGTCTDTMQGHTDWVNALSLSADGLMLFSAAKDGTVRQWNVTDGTCVCVMEGHGKSVKALALSPDGRTLFSGARDCRIKEWDVTDSRCTRTLDGHTDEVRSLAVTADGYYLFSGSSDTTLKQWSLSDGSCVRTLSEHTGPVYSLCLSVDNRMLFSGSGDGDHSIKQWRVTDGACVRTVQGHTDSVWALAVSVDGRTVYSGSDDETIKQWHVEGGTCTRTMETHTSSVTALCLSADGCTLLSGSDDNTIRRQSVRHGACTRHAESHPGVKTLVNHNGWMLFSRAKDVESIKQWNVYDGSELAPADKTQAKEAFQKLAQSQVTDGTFTWKVQGKAIVEVLAEEDEQEPMVVWSAAPQVLRTRGVLRENLRCSEDVAVLLDQLSTQAQE